MEQSSALAVDAGRNALPGTVPNPEAARRRDVRAHRAAIIFALFLGMAILGLAEWQALKLLPDQVSVRLLGHSLNVRQLHQRFANNAALIFFLLPAALILEGAIVGWTRCSARQLLFRPTASGKTDVACFLLGQAHILDVAGRLLMLGASMLSGVWIRDWLASTFGVSINLGPLPMPLQVVAYFFVYSFFDYWTHRLDHSRLFWPLHRYHHAADEFSVVNATRQHPAAFTAIFFINMPMAVLGAPPAVILYVNVLTTALGFVIHSKIDSDFGWIGRYVIQSPTHHRLHHILDISEQPAGHFAMAPIWDHLFGTWRGDADQSLAIGVDTPYRHGFWVVPDLLRDYLDFWKGFIPRRRATP